MDRMTKLGRCAAEDFGQGPGAKVLSGGVSGAPWPPALPALPALPAVFSGFTLW